MSIEDYNKIVDEQKAKTYYSIRTIELGNNTMQMLLEYKNWQERYKMTIGYKWMETNRVFTDKYGNYTYPSTTNNILQKI